MNHQSIGFPVLFAATAILIGCGGGAGSGPQAVALETKSDVLREIAHINPALIGAPVANSQASQQKSRTIGTRNRAWKRGSARSKEAQVTECGSGSFSNESFTGSRRLKHFSVNETMDYEVDIYDQCQFGTTEFQGFDGYTEGGNNWQYADGTTVDPRYDYEVYGRNGTPYIEIEGDADATFAQSSLGRDETMNAGSIERWRLVVAYGLSFSDDTDSYTETIAYGSPGNPAEVLWDYAADTVSLSGRLQYAGDLCDGGVLTIETPDPLTVGSSGGEFVNGGQLRIRSGGKSVTLTYASNGDASYQFASGESGLITRAEFDAATGCLVQ